MTDTDFSVQKVTNDQAKSDHSIFEHQSNTDWLSYGLLIFNIFFFIIFATYFFTHRHHHAIQKTLNKNS